MDEAAKEARLNAIVAWRELLFSYSADARLLENEINFYREKLKMLEMAGRLLGAKMAVAQVQLNTLGAKVPRDP